MWLKVVIVILFIGVVFSLSAGLRFLLQDAGNSSKRTLYALGIRVTFAGLLIICIVYGFYSGMLTTTAPWDAKLYK